MEDERNQKELFEFDKPKKSFLRLPDILPKADFERNILVTLSLDKVIFVSIGIIMLLVIVYALGVEVGRSRALEKALSARSPVAVKAVARPKEATAPQPAPKALPEAKKALNVPQAATGGCVIVAGTFSRNDNALAVLSRLKREGINAYVGRYGKYFQVYTGPLESKTSPEAQRELAKVRRIYKDAYIKER